METKTKRIRWLAGSALVVVLLLVMIPLAEQRRERLRWHPMAVGNLASVHVERAFYRRPGSDEFFVCVRTTNTSGRPLSVSLSDPLYPVAIFEATASTRFQFDGARLGSLPLTSTVARKKQKVMLRRRRAGRLTALPAGQSLFYFWRYRQTWSAARLTQQTSPFTLVMMRGEIPVTDDSRLEILDFMRWIDPVDSSSHSNIMVFIPNPVPWKVLPPDARILDANTK